MAHGLPRGFSSCGSRAYLPGGVWNLGSSVRNQTHVPCIARLILNHWTTREVPGYPFLNSRGPLSEEAGKGDSEPGCGQVERRPLGAGRSKEMAPAHSAASSSVPSFSTAVKSPITLSQAPQGGHILRLSSSFSVKLENSSWQTPGLRQAFPSPPAHSPHFFSKNPRSRKSSSLPRCVTSGKPLYLSEPQPCCLIERGPGQPACLSRSAGHTWAQ